MAYAILVVPGVNILILSTLLVLTAALVPYLAAAIRILWGFFGFRKIESRNVPPARIFRSLSFLSNPLIIMATSSAVFISVLIADTELMIRRNAALRQREEADWTFGQVLALAVIIIPCLELLSSILETIPAEWTARLRVFHSAEGNDTKCVSGPGLASFVLKCVGVSKESRNS